MNFDNLYTLIDGIQSAQGLFRWNIDPPEWKEISAKKVLTISITHLNDISKYRVIQVNTRIPFVLGLDKVKERFAEMHDAVLKNKIIQVNHGNGWIDEKDSKRIFFFWKSCLCEWGMCKNQVRSR